jgi:hypothetical protein
LGDDVSAILCEDMTINLRQRMLYKTNINAIIYGAWGFNGICKQQKQQFKQFDAKFKNNNGQYFEHLIPIKCVK